MVKEKESDILRTIMDGLAAKRIWAIRMNSGAMFGSHKGKRWAVKFGRKGMADILISQPAYNISLHKITWIEVKRPGEKQTADQVNFQYEVEAEGHKYVMAHSWEELCEKL